MLTNEEYAKEIIDKIKSHNEIDILEDGHYYFFPSRTHAGGINAYQLRVIADYLDERNKIIEREIDEYFSGTTTFSGDMTQFVVDNLFGTDSKAFTEECVMVGNSNACGCSECPKSPQANIDLFSPTSSQ